MIKTSFLAVLLVFFSSFALDYEEIKKSYYRSYQYEKTGDYENAVKALSFVYNEYPDSYTVNLRLGWLYYLMKKYANSVFHYEKAIKAAPYSVEAKLGLTLPLLAQQKFSDVEKVCYQILKTDYYSYYGNLRLSYVLRAQKKFKEAKSVDIKMLTLYPTDVNFLLELALSEFYMGNKKDAQKLFKDILILDPENPTAKEYLKKF
ncbi:tetratricopeptide repeat protein [Persephonella sp.]